MDISNTPTEASAPGPWTRRRRLTLALTAVALVAGGGVAIAAGQPDADPTEPATTAAKPVPGKAVFGLGGVLHSESVVSDGNGGYVTQLTQVGTIESIDSDRMTVASEDGYERSWSRTSDTVVGGGGWSVEENDDGSFTVRKDTEDLAVGDTVVVVGTLSDDVATAQRIAARPDTGEIPGGILKRFEGELGDRFGDKFGGQFEDQFGGAPMLKDRLRGRFEHKMPGGMEGREKDGTVTVPAPAPAQPSSVTSSGYVSIT